MMDIYRPGFVYTVEHLDAAGAVKSTETHKNIIPMDGLNYIVGAAFKGVSAYTDWYLSVFTANRTPVTGDTMTTLLADCVESVAYTTTGGARATITFPAIDAGTLSTTADPNILVFPAGETVRGAFITTNVTRGGTTGLLLSAVLFPSPKILAAGEMLRVPVGFALVSA